jgi:hypothetical protein
MPLIALSRIGPPLAAQQERARPASTPPGRLHIAGRNSELGGTPGPAVRLRGALALESDTSVVWDRQDQLAHASPERSPQGSALGQARIGLR